MNNELLSCPFCGGHAMETKVLREGYENNESDADAWAHFVVCASCAAQGGWAKSESGARRWWNMREHIIVEVSGSVIDSGRAWFSVGTPKVIFEDDGQAST